MVDVKMIPGYLSLSEAEERYGVKADTLKKRCQKGEIIGAKKVGKTWLVPKLPGIDPEKTIPENYPKLDFDIALKSNSDLYDAESEVKVMLYEAHKIDVYIWEYGFYFFSLIFRHAQLERTYLPLAVLISEAHRALRGSFLLNLRGYHTDAHALLRKAHECTIKALAMRTEPEKMWGPAFAKSREKSEHKIGVDFQGPWEVASSFSHGNIMKLFEVGRDLQDGKIEISVPYGPQVDHKLYIPAMNTSIFWLFILVKSLPYLFTDQIGSSWISKKDDAAKLLRDYLVSKKVLTKEIKSFELAIIKLEKKLKL